MSRYCLTLSSAEFGSEDFWYDTAAEAWQGLRRLTKAAAQQERQDGIRRQVLYTGKREEETR